MKEQDFKRLYLGEWKPDPDLKDCVDILLNERSNPNPKGYRAKDLFSKETIKQAKRILEYQSS